MISEWIRAALDVMLIVVVGSGLVQAARLIRHLQGLRQGRVDMERFVYEFNATVLRAEAGIKGLRHAARESGDDLEKLVEKAVTLRDELQYIVEHGDQLAERITKASSNVGRPDAKVSESASPASRSAGKPAIVPDADSAVSSEKSPAARSEKTTDSSKNAPSSRAEKELLQALQKLN